jgi:transcriptional regulator with PAS, ATPase and Fis domain
VDVRVVAATNKNLEDLVRQNQFRKDLFYRIRVVQMTLPGLQDRRVDIPVLVDHMVAKFNQIKGKDIAGVSDQVLARLMDYDYPGNVRELENIIEHAFVLCRAGFIEIQHLPPELRVENETTPSETTGSMTLKSMEKRMIFEALRRHQGHRRNAAGELGVDYSTLYRKIKEYHIETPVADGRKRKR